MRPPTTSEYKTPILSTIFSVFGVLALLGALLSILFSPTTAVMLAIAGIIYFGFAQVIDYLGRTAHSTDRLCTILESSVVQHIKSIESRLSSTTPFHVRMDSVPAAPPPRSTRPGAVYHYAADGAQQGPFTAADMQDFRAASVITDDTPVFRDGETQWRTLRDFPEVSA